MIVFEDRLEEIFSYLPKIGYGDSDKLFEVVFGHGDRKELNAFLKHKHKGDSPYPLIWLLYPYAEIHSKNHVEVRRVSLILAVSTNTSMQNKQRLEETYKKVLIPLYDNIVYSFDKANVVNTAHKYTVVKHPNYSDDEALGGSHAGAFIWDALKMTFDLKVNDVCLKPIIF